MNFKNLRQHFYRSDVFGLALSILGTLLIAFAFGELPFFEGYAYYGNSIYRDAYFLHPSWFKIGIILLILGFIFQLIEKTVKPTMKMNNKTILLTLIAVFIIGFLNSFIWGKYLSFLIYLVGKEWKMLFAQNLNVFFDIISTIILIATVIYIAKQSSATKKLADATLMPKVAFGLLSGFPQSPGNEIERWKKLGTQITLSNYSEFPVWVWNKISIKINNKSYEESLGVRLDGEYSWQLNPHSSI